jgi:hypothetical protein
VSRTGVPRGAKELDAAARSMGFELLRHAGSGHLIYVKEGVPGQVVVSSSPSKFASISELGTDNEDDPEYVEPDYLIEIDMSDYDPKDFGDELRLAMGLSVKNGKPSKYAPGPSSGQFNSYSGLKPISEEELAVAPCRC